MVNVGGFLAVQRLTTNVTGHFAFFVDEVYKMNLWQGLIYFLYIFFFFLGSFVAGLLVELVAKENERLIYVAPVVIESAILLMVGILFSHLARDSPDVIACCLLFAMGMQNSLVTTISNSVVRTTHLTGLFTDLGIELSQLLFYKSRQHKQKLFASIRLRLTIISFFFFGGVITGIVYSYIGLYVLVIASALLIGGLIYDNIKFRIIQLKRRWRSMETDDPGNLN
ncbi:hypothetical protein DYBT9275_03917 [Dyadobacter sp. CECT 9275]|uniref:DUF1275 domain-containing protein n=2 Tax=Dyadobacter helix TaxID=2822344 RepID=A0A916JEB8_9BACT|nr:hypothetical protein DYBT9275_03917 [Dyadobacter sp. CECT 9275]